MLLRCRGRTGPCDDVICPCIGDVAGCGINDANRFQDELAAAVAIICCIYASINDVAVHTDVEVDDIAGAVAGVRGSGVDGAGSGDAGVDPKASRVPVGSASCGAGVGGSAVIAEDDGTGLGSADEAAVDVASVDGGVAEA